MNRRKFFSFLPLAPAAMMVEGAKAETESMAPNENSGISITLQGSKPRKKVSNQFLKYYSQEIDPDRKVSLSVGQDGRLWLKTNDGQWQRVMVENG